FAALLRLLWLSDVPGGLHIDEAVIGYDAYSILHTGKDHTGAFLPVFARSLGDYDEALYRYLTIPFVYLGGLTVWATRLPSALAGIVTVVVVFFLARQFFDDRVALVAALFLAISPWHVLTSRWAVRAILLPLFFCLGLLFFLKGVRHSRGFVLSSLFFGICLHTYSSARVFVLLFLIGLVFIYRRDLLANKRQLVTSGLLFIAVLIPTFLFWISPEGMIRARSTLILNLFDNVYNYATYFSPSFLFFNGDTNIRDSIAEMGVLHYFEAVTLPIGCWQLWRRQGENCGVLWLYLILYPLPAALTEPSHLLRAFSGAPLFAMLSASGAVRLWDAIGNLKWAMFGRVASLMVVCVGVALFAKFYYWDYPKYSFGQWHQGVKEAIDFAVNTQFRCIIFSYKLYPDIYTLFFTAYPPDQYHALSQDTKRHFLPYKEKTFHFGRVGDLILDDPESCLLILEAAEIPELNKKGYTRRVLHQVDDPRGDRRMVVVEVDNR
ncbi:MAG: glycosyltransferase family 39 protein, partial [Candidatus Latescibacteria bacterium]|nr:glycosyltransferase family 39 protein [Candidatus Latescibacterota bacterium]